jgi:diketogulonate reductase-like aldo/keto reductase
MTRLPSLKLGPTGERIPLLGQGTWNMERDARGECIAALQRGIDLGLTLIDTAELYGHGKVEELVGAAIEGRRDDVFLVSKVLPTNASRDGTVKAMQRTLKRLGTDHVDLYLLHWPGDWPIEDTMAAFRQLVDEGLTRYVGVSNFELDEFDEAQKAAGDLPLVTDQVYYWLGARSIENAILPGMVKRGVTVMAYSPYGSGRLPPLATARGKVLAEIAARHDATPHLVALAWVLHHEGVMTIPKASQVAHVEENVKALEIKLGRADMAALDESFPRPRTAGLEFV